MAAQSKTTAVHFSLIIFVMLSVILGVVALLFYNDYRNQEAQFKQNQDALREAEGSVRKMGEEITALKNVIGITAEEVGTGGADEGTVLGQSQQLIQTLGTNPAAASFKIALQDLRNEVNNKTKLLAQREAAFAELQAKFGRLDTQYASVSKEHDDQRAASETDLAGVQTKFDESMAAKDQEINGLREQFESVQTELANTKGQMETQLAEAGKLITNLRNNVRLLRDELDDVVGMSFEVADGAIVSVDQVGRTVWINLGEADGLKPRTTFSVYMKGNKGIGREGQNGGRPEDIKGSIEIVQILGDKMAEARILSEDSSRPISPGDPIYTPLWGAGRSESFAFAGALDIDGDGNYTGDRERLHEIIKGNGAEITAELLVTGERRGGEIDQNTKFLVKGEIPDVTEAPPNSEQQQQYRELAEQYSKLALEAESNGVRIIGLNTFLDIIGFVPQQNRFVPGESRNWSLDAGAPERTDRSSSGSTSGLFDQSRSRPNPAGETSQRFGGE